MQVQWNALGPELPFNRIFELADRIVTLEDGRIVKDVRPAAKI